MKIQKLEIAISKWINQSINWNRIILLTRRNTKWEFYKFIINWIKTKRVITVTSNHLVPLHSLNNNNNWIRKINSDFLLCMRLRQIKNSFLMNNHKTQFKFYKMNNCYRRNKRDQNMNIKTLVSTNLYISKEDKKFFRFNSLIKNFKFLSFWKRFCMRTCKQISVLVWKLDLISGWCRNLLASLILFKKN